MQARLEIKIPTRVPKYSEFRTSGFMFNRVGDLGLEDWQFDMYKQGSRESYKSCFVRFHGSECGSSKGFFVKYPYPR